MNIEISTVSNTITSIFLLVMMGFIARKCGLIDDNFSKKLSSLVVYIGSPALVISSILGMEYSKEGLSQGFIIMLIGIVTYIFIYLLTYIAGIFYKNQEQKNIVAFALEYSNSGFMGIPVMTSLLGDTGRFWAAFYVIFFNIIIWVHGISILKRKIGTNKIDILKVFVNWGTVPGVIGILLFAFRINLPAPVLTAVDYASNIATPISMFVIGGLIATIPFKKLFLSARVYLFCFIRLIAVPLIVLLTAKICGLPDGYAIFITVITSLPAASNTVLFSEQFDLDSRFAAHSVGMSTLLSVLTVPLVVFIADFVI